MSFDNVPQEMKDLKQWVCWSLVTRQGKKTKLPINAITGKLASSTDPETWSTFEQAVAASKNFSGIGFVFSENDQFFGVDLDGSIDMELVEWFATYTERSQSGTGAHIIGKGKLNRKGTKITTGDHAGIEVYDRGRYFVVTGDIIHPEPIRDCQEQLNEFVRAVLPAEQDVDLSRFLPPPATMNHIESDIIQQIRESDQGHKFDTLWSGNWRHIYGSQSEADAALLSILRFWTGGDQSESFALFRQSGLMRKKAERIDYLNRTWAKIDSGDVKEKIEHIISAPRIMKEQSAAPWRKITIEHVKRACQGTILDTMATAICAPTDPPMPYEVGLLKALALSGAAISGKGEGRRLANYISRGHDCSKVCIDTAGGQAMNFYCLLVGQSAMGKDIGNIMQKAAMQCKLLIGSAGSEEGIMDSYVEKPTGLLCISEMLNFLDQKHWQSRAAGFLTTAFNAGWFDQKLSRRSDAVARTSDYCFPNIFAAVQPGILQVHASRTALDSGFLGRFIIARMPDEFLPYPRCYDAIEDVLTVKRCIESLQRKHGRIRPDNRYPEPLYKLFQGHKAKPEPTWRRLSSEYYPRLALLLSIATGEDSDEARITRDGWDRAMVLTQYFFAQAEEALGGICSDPVIARFEDLCDRILRFIRGRKDGKCNKTEIGWHLGKNTRAKERTDAINELASRGEIEICQLRGGGAELVAKVP